MPELPPRTIPAAKKRLLFFSSPLVWFGFIFLIFGSVMALVFGASADLKSPFYFSDSDPTVTGTLLGKVGTNASENKSRIFEYHYRYTVAGQSFEGRSFAHDNYASPGDPADVQYATADPGKSRLFGQRLAPFDWPVLVMSLLFPGIGTAILTFKFKKYRKHLYLLRYGTLTTAKVTRKVATRARVNGAPVYNVTFQFHASDGMMYEATNTCLDSSCLGDEEREPLVYDINDPSKAVLLDTLPSEIREMLGAA